MDVVVLLFAAFALLTTATLALGAAAWLARGLLRVVVLLGVALIWFGYFLCFPRQALTDWRAAREGEPAVGLAA